jgi:FKBP-type peptidyl-prolyl cis-trans isomerase
MPVSSTPSESFVRANRIIALLGALATCCLFAATPARAAGSPMEDADLLARTQAAGPAYLAANAKKPGVKTTASGLQYRVLREGKGARPTAADAVTVHYRGTLVDGSEFDSSYQRGEPITFPLSRVIKGWTEGLQLMQVGAKYELVIPPELAYGDRGPLARQALVFEVELLDVGVNGDTSK